MRRVAFLWHLHQPDYRDPLTGVPVMPWVRLHALRGYRDMVLETAEGRLPWTLNVVPSLLEQLEHYADGGSDPHLDLTRVPADSLGADQVATIRGTFVCGHPAMQEAWPEWKRLAARVVRHEPLNTGDLRDLQVWSTLGWFGATAARDLPVVTALRRKGRGFDEADKEALLDAQAVVLGEVRGWWRRLPAHRLSVSPAYHPILPLLVDARAAHRSQPHLPDDVDFRYPEDARRQLELSRDALVARTGRAPWGLWPSEGSVSPEVVELAGAAGFRWLCSDEGVLGRSTRTGSGAGGWDLGHGVTGFFRDTELSDAIGFRTAGRDPEQAAREWVAALDARQGVVLVALDGENPWESHQDAGAGFREALWRALRGRRVDPVDALLDEDPVGRVHHLHSGSWIGATFAIWAGHPEDRRAWRALADARRAVREAGDPEPALRHLYAAEGSDWFWWYGEEFHTPFARTFDALFRSHLVAAWRALGREPPDALARTLLDPDPIRRVEPTRWVEGPLVGFVRELGCGRIGVPQGAMARGAPPELRFGWEVGGARLHLHLVGAEHRLVVDGVEVIGATWSGGPRAAVQVMGPEGPAWAEPIALEPPGPGSGWWV